MHSIAINFVKINNNGLTYCIKNVGPCIPLLIDDKIYNTKMDFNSEELFQNCKLIAG